MSPAVDLFTGVLGIIGVIALVTVLAEFIRSVVLYKQDLPQIEGLIGRINAWWAMLALVTLAMLAGRWGLMVLFLGVSFSALREFLTLTVKTRADHWALLAAFFVILPAQYLLVGLGWERAWELLIPVYVCLFLPVLSVMRGAPERLLTRAGETQWGLMVAVFAMSYLPALVMLDLPGAQGREVLLIAFLVLVVQLADAARYAWGRFLGGHRIAPTLARSKTWEGFGAGVIAAALIGAALNWLTPFGAPLAGLVAALSTLMGFFGGLVITAFKADKGVRDWGHLVAGHGGFIDRFDSVIFAAPVFYHLVQALAG